MIELNNTLININRVNYIEKKISDADGYTYKTTYILIFHFGEAGGILKLKTYDKNEYDKWLEVIANETKNR